MPRLHILFLLALAACGSSADAPDDTQSADSTSSSQPTATIRTQLGNKAFVDFVVDPPTGAGFASPGFVITYEDRANAFGHALAIDTTVTIHKSDGTVDKGTIALTDGTGGTPKDKPVTYTGVFIVGDTLVGSAEIAFAQGKTTDPKNAATPYHFSFDRSDTRCAVVLRTVQAPDFSAPPSGAFFVWKGTVDVATKVLDQANVGVQWHTNSNDRAASQLVTREVSGAPNGFRRFAFELTHDTLPTNGIDDTFLTSFQIGVIPFVNLADGTRIFDHNRVADLQDYGLWSGDTAGGLVTPPPNANIGKRFEVKDDSSICRSPR
jgi:hypothetical protein